MSNTRIAAVVAAGALAVGGVALLVPTSADAATQAVDAAAKGKGLSTSQKATLKQSGHLTFTRTTKKGKAVTVLVQRGQITALSPTSVTLKSPDGYTHAYVLDRKSQLRGRGLTQLGEKAQVIAVHGSKGDEARRLRHGFKTS